MGRCLLIMSTFALLLTGCTRSNGSLHDRLARQSASTTTLHMLCSEIQELNTLDANQEQVLRQITELEFEGSYLDTKFPCELFPKLTKLSFRTCVGRPKLISELQKCAKSITSARLVDTGVDERSLAALSEIRSLQQIEFEDCGIAKKEFLRGLEHFKDSPELRIIRFSYCELDSKIVEDVRTLLPSVKVEADF
jgi:hypothetical protein